MFPPDIPIKIVEHLYLGNFNAASAKNLSNNNITSVVCLTRDSQEYQLDENINLLHIDSISEDLSEQSFTLDKLEDAVDFIEKEINNGNNVLIHCKAGASRSPTVVIAYLIKTNKWTITQSTEYVRSLAWHINPTFTNLLEKYAQLVL